MVFTVIALVIGVMIFLGGLYYLQKEKYDADRKIYLITVIAGAIIVAVAIGRAMMLA